MIGAPPPARIVCLGLAAGCASTMKPDQGQTAEQIEKDKTECAAAARATGRGEFGNWWPFPGIGWWPVDAAILGVGLIGGTTRYLRDPRATYRRPDGRVHDLARLRVAGEGRGGRPVTERPG
jgi:hypothetical protein